MENLTEEEKKKVIIKIVVSILVLIVLIIIGLVLTFGVNISNKLKGEVINSDNTEKASATCDDLISENYGFIGFRSPDYDDSKLKKILPVTIDFVDRKTNVAYTKTIGIEDIICLNCDDKSIRLPQGNYDFKITKPGYLYSYYENSTITAGQTKYTSSNFFNLIPGDINGDGYINQSDLDAFSSYKGKYCSSLDGEKKEICNAIDFNENGNIDNDDFESLKENVGKVFSWYKNWSEYYGKYILDQEDFELTYGQTMQLTYHTTDYFKPGYYASWTSSNTKVATVKDGLVTPISTGTTQIKYGNSDPITVTVVEKGEILLEETDITMEGITEKQIKYSYSDDSTFKSSKPTFTSSNSSIITVDENGIIKSLKAGTAKVTMKVGFGTTATINVTVNDVQAEDFTINENNMVFNGYEQKQISISPLPSNATIYKYSYEVVDSEFASVTTDGVVTSKKSGSTKVKVTLTQDEKEISRYVDIKINYVQTESISYENTLSFNGASSTDVKVTYYPENGLDRTIVATSDDVYKDTSNKILSSIVTRDGNIRVTSAYPGDAVINFSIDREEGSDLTGVINTHVEDVAITRLNVPGGTFSALSYFISVSVNPYPSNYTKNHSVGTYSISSGSSNSFATASLSGSTLTVRRRAGQYSGSLTVCVRSSTGYSGCGTFSK